MLPEELAPLTPVNFFQIQVDCHYLDGGKADRVFPCLDKRNSYRYLLPDTSGLCSEEAFAAVALGWHEDGVECFVNVDAPVKQVRYPDVELGDSVELFIDTRDVKTSGFNTRFCHHFFFLPEAVEGHHAGEKTHFRTEDTHPLCDSSELKLKSLVHKQGYFLNIFIPTHCFYGYDPVQFNRLGFTYRINRAAGFPQHFSVVTDDFAIDQQPSLWASLKLVHQ